MIERSINANKSMLVLGCCLFGSYSVWMQLLVPSTNVLTALLIWLAYHSRMSYARIGLLLGTAAAVKLTAWCCNWSLVVLCGGLRQRSLTLLVWNGSIVSWL